MASVQKIALLALEEVINLADPELALMRQVAALQSASPPMWRGASTAVAARQQPVVGGCRNASGM
jgi:hypothetical protein